VPSTSGGSSPTFAAREANLCSGPKFCLAFVDDYRTFLVDTGMPHPEEIAKLAAEDESRLGLILLGRNLHA
jgi:hypothetical protein